MFVFLRTDGILLLLRIMNALKVGKEFDMQSEKVIREYVDDYVKYFPERWKWRLKNTHEQSELFFATRARRNKDIHQNCDLLPDFYSIERDAAQFGLRSVEWTDFFGLTWVGEKGVHAYVGAPNYTGSLYYYDPDDEYDEPGYRISECYDAYEYQPPRDTYTRITWCGVNRWIDTKNVVDIEYSYIVGNHLFKDTQIVLIYKDGEKLTVYDEYSDLINGLIKNGKKSLVKKVFKTMNEHFNKLRDSKSAEERKFYPGMTAEEMFLGDDNKNKQVECSQK